MYHMRQINLNLLQKKLLVEVFVILWRTNSLSKCICQYITGRGTKLNIILNLEAKEWSLSINRVDNAAYHHNLCYSKHDDTKTRNEVCDKTMLGELSGIVNPTLW